MKWSEAQATEAYKVIDPNCPDMLVGRWDNVCIDECHIIKNDDGSTSTALREIKARMTILGSATPGMNTINDFKGYLPYLQPRRAVSLGDYRDLLGLTAAEREKQGLPAPDLDSYGNVYNNQVGATQKQIQLNPQLAKKWIFDNGDSMVAAASLRSIQAQTVVRRNYATVINGKKVGSDLPRLVKRSVTTTFDEAGKALYKQYAAPHLKRLIRTIPGTRPPKICWNNKYARKLIGNSTWLGWEDCEDMLTADKMQSIKKDRNWLHKALLKVQANRPEDSYDVAPLGEDLKHAELVLKEAPKLRVGLAVTGDVVVRKCTKLIIWVALPGEEALVEKVWRAFHFDARMISSDMSQEARRDVIEAFNTRDDACQILILTHAIGSSGLNLQYKCYTCIHLAVPLSRAQRDQADHRIRRWGQEKDRWNESYDCTSWATQVKDTFNDRQWLNNLRKAYPSVLTELNKYIFNYQLRENAIGQVELEIPNWVKFRGRFLRDNDPRLEGPDVTPDDIEIANPEELMEWIADLERGKDIPFGE